MQLTTLRFGDIEIEEDKLIEFPTGMPGFEHLTKFALLTPDLSVPFSFMQSTEDGDISFIIADPFVYFSEYDFEVSETVQKELGISGESDVMVFSIVSISDEDEFSLNLLAPVIVNTALKRGKQVILHQSAYKTKHAIQLQMEADSTEKSDASC
ncbi:flagellar assembly protein FliW [Paenibacillus sp. YYML68]|uniref:flagellar assembly protein FliW n=1 Tax=Paenibacillus sp. YYML68 TaxID=2909250 RepID=UPI00248F5AE3|nr:flagellar assembly protein FliW [Paenibacillus sp. YYML68]